MGVELILGPPGTGKTTTLLNIMEREMERGVAPDRIAFVSFTRKAATEAAERAAARFGLERDQLVYFRTLHSLAFQQLELSRTDVLSAKHLKAMGELLGVKFGGNTDAFGLAAGSSIGDKMLRIEQLARLRMRPGREVWGYHRDVDPVDWFQLMQFVKTYRAYKQDMYLLDFTDMLERFTTDVAPLGVEVAIIDEAQDLSALQWKMVWHAFSKTPRVYVAGDDDQAIYRWSGADVDQFLSVPGERRVLDRSYRLPQRVWEAGNTISGRIAHRYAKTWKPDRDGGSVEHLARFEHVLPKMEGGKWMVLTRHVHQLQTVDRLLRLDGVAFTNKDERSVDREHVDAILAWGELRRGQRISGTRAQSCLDMIGAALRLSTERDYGMTEIGPVPDVVWFEAFSRIPLARREYYRACLRRGDDLRAEPRIHINTIHGVKGGEADNVVLFTDITNRVDRARRVSPDDEHRVFYVGATRAKQNLYVVTPQTNLNYRL